MIYDGKLLLDPYASRSIDLVTDLFDFILRDRNYQ